MPPREGQRLIDKIRQIAAVTGYWPLVIAVFLLISLPYFKLESAYEERMRTWGRLVQMGIEQETISYQPALDMIWQRGDEHKKYRVIAGAMPCVWLASAAILRKPLRSALHLDATNDSQSGS